MRQLQNRKVFELGLRMGIMFFKNIIPILSQVIYSLNFEPPRSFYIYNWTILLLF